MNFDFKQHIENILNKKLGSQLTFSWQPISGGCINLAYKISSGQGSFFIKINDNTIFKNGFKEEVLGLRFLSKHSATVPKIIENGCFNNTIYLILEWIEAGIESNAFWRSFAEQLALLHQQSNTQFGLNHSNFIGSLIQNNTQFNNFSIFFIENRLKPQVKLAFDNGKLKKKHVKQFEKLYLEIPAIFPTEKPSAIHGDLWSGNFICSTNEKAVFIDPAVYYGHREADLAMTKLFGGFSPSFYDSYEEIYPLEKGFEKRKNIFNLYPLLIHLNLFGNSYFRSIENIINIF